MLRFNRTFFKVAHYFHKRRKLPLCRKVTVGIFVDNALLANGNKWQTMRLILHSINTASHCFEKDFGITFRAVKFFIWKLPPDTPALNGDWLLEDIGRLSHKSSNRFQILLGFTDRIIFSLHHCAKTNGHAIYLGQAAIIRIHEYIVRSLLHELGHLFGADHVKTFSVMNYETPEALNFDEANKKVIYKHRNRSFK